MKTSVQFVNHASVIVSDGETSVLSDPWYSGDAFHKGWNLLHENPNEEVKELLRKVTHIWVSHEHPDHFSVPFFRTFSEEIKGQSIKILFQKTRDKRVYRFLVSQGFDVQELDNNQKEALSGDFSVTCLKDGFYDSALLIESHGEKILNLNDCDISTPKRLNQVFALTGCVDILMTQFSFAAWKGGENNKKWREDAATDKVNTVKLQIERFRPSIMIPIASFIYFSNSDNFYLNDAHNSPEQLKEKLEEYAHKIVVMAPGDILGGDRQLINQSAAAAFWNDRYKALTPVHQYQPIEFDVLNESFEKYSSRIHANNNMSLIKFLGAVSPIRVFKPVVIHLSDLRISVQIDYVRNLFTVTHEPAMLTMKSQSLDFIFNNAFGFDTLTVNGCFEEKAENGFIDATKTLAIENLNNLGIKIELKTLFQFKMIGYFLRRLAKVRLKLTT